MARTRIAGITVGQAPRTDMTADLESRLSSTLELVQYGALDDLTVNDVERDLAPEPGDEVLAGETACDVESVKAVSDVMSPVTGVIAEVNEELDDSPELLNSDPYEAWIMKIEHITDFSELLSAEEYEAFTKEEH